MDNPSGHEVPGEAGSVLSWRVVGLVVTAWVVALALWLPGSAPGPTASATGTATGTPTPTAQARERTELADAVAVLRDWDERRAAAWAAEDPRALRELYAAGSRAAAVDLALLRRWRDAGWRVEDLRSQLLAVSVVRATPERLVLRVVDRVAGGRVVARSGPARTTSLPGTTARTRTLELRRGTTGWRLAVSRAAGG